MNVLEPLSTYSSPSRRAVESIEPKASEPLLGSVIAQAPTFSSVRSWGTQRSFWAMVPVDWMADAVSPDRHAHRGHHARAVAAQLDDRDEGVAGVAATVARRLVVDGLTGFDRLLVGDALRERRPGHLVHAEGLVELAEHVVGGQVAVFEIFLDGKDLLGDEVAHRLLQHEVFVRPFVHGGERYLTGRSSNQRA